MKIWLLAVVGLVAVVLAGCGESEETRLAREINAIRVKIGEVPVPPTTDQQVWLKQACPYMKEREDREADIARATPGASYIQRMPMPQCQWLAANPVPFVVRQ